MKPVPSPATGRHSPRVKPSPPEDLAAVLRRSFVERRRRNPRYSVRAFARSLGVSHTAANDFLKARSAPSLDTARKILGRLALDPAVIAGTLRKIRLDRERDPEVRRALGAKGKTARAVRLDPSRFEADGLLAAVSVLAALSLRKVGDRVRAAEVAGRGRIDPARAERVLRALADSGLVERAAGAREYVVTGRRWEFSATSHSAPLKRAHLQGLKIVGKRLIEVAPADRFSATETIAISRKDLSAFQAKCEEFLDDLQELADRSATESDEVLLLSLHAVPWLRK